MKLIFWTLMTKKTKNRIKNLKIHKKKNPLNNKNLHQKKKKSQIIRSQLANQQMMNMTKGSSTSQRKTSRLLQYNRKELKKILQLKNMTQILITWIPKN